MAFDVRNIMFAGNKTLDDGGAIYVFTPSTFTFNAENINFSANASNASGGAIAAHSSEFTFSADNINFSGNTAANGSGGAIHANSSVFTFDGANINFSGNTANEKGGAIYNAGVLNLASAGSIIFAGNTAGGVDNDIYNAIGSTINITGSGNVIIGGGINGEGIINKTGEGTLCLGGKNDIGELNATNGVIKIESGSKYTGGILKAQGAAINMQNGTDEEIKLTGLFISETNLKIDVMADGKNDKVTASSATVGGNLDIKTMVGDYTSGVEYEILSATGGVYGVFASSGIMNAEKLNYEIKYLSDKIILSVTGLYKSEFETMLGLTYNQSETARVFDTISENAGAFAAIITEMEEKRTSADEQDRKDVLSFLAHTSGYFIANVIRNAAADSPSDEIYDKIKNHKGEKTNNGVWLQAKGGEEIFKEDAQSPENYKDKSIGVMAGIDRYDEDKNIMYGAYARLNQDNIEQGKNKADAVKSGIGIYGGYIKESWEIKAMALGSYDKFETQRAVMGEKAKGNIEAITINADIEGALNIWATENIKIRPYGAIEAANANYGEIKEKEGGIYNLKIKSGNYVRTSARIGAGAQYIKGIWLGYAEIEGKYLISGERPEIESVFEARSEEFKSRGTEEGKAMIGAGLGGEAQAGKNWTIFANVKIYAGEKYESITANAGVRYVFGR
jgi:predicted outer membrane repeat protein